MAEGADARRPGIAARALRGAVRFYQLGISPLLGPSCRFAPTCSEYAREALSEHGAWRGSWLALRRLLRCNPFCKGGYDPVPAARRRRTGKNSAKSITSPVCDRAGAADLGDTLDAPTPPAPGIAVTTSAADPGSTTAGPSGAAAAPASVVSFNQEAGECLC